MISCCVDEMADNQLYEVEQILGKKIVPKEKGKGNQILYLVRWRGFSSEHDTWEPVQNLKACKLLLLKHDKKISSKKSRQKSASLNDVTRKTISVKKAKALVNKVKTNTHKYGTDAHKKWNKTSVGKTSPENGPSKHEVKANKISSIKKNDVEQSVVRSGEKENNTALNMKKAAVKSSKSKTILKKLRNRVDHIGDRTLSVKKTVKRKLNGNNTVAEDVVGGSSVKKRKLANESNEAEKQKEESDEDVFIVEEISDEETDDDNILYSLNTDCDSENIHVEKTETTKNKDLNEKSVQKKVKNSSKAKKNVNESDTPVINKPVPAKKKGKSKKDMSLMESKKKTKDWIGQTGLLRSVSPPPLFTSVKHLTGDLRTDDPSKPSGNSLPDPVSPEASETYLADVPSSYSLAAEGSISEKEPLSSDAISYQSLLESLPDLNAKGAKKGNSKSLAANGRDSTGNVASLLGLASGVGREPVERRTSVRTTECAFRYKQIVVKKCLRYTQIWLNTQTVMHNALNPQVIQELVSALNSAKYDDSHLVLFSSLGNVFCSGTDLHFLVSGDRRMAARQMADSIRELTKTFITFPKPVIAAVSGAAVGLGVSLLALCDIVYASDKASFHLPYSQLSQTPEGCSSFTLPLTVGIPSANELLYGGRKITAMEAYQLGLVSQVFWPTLMMQEVIPRAQNMAICSAKALEATKLLIRSHHRTKMELTNETECNILLERWSSVDCQRAMEAYLSNEKNLSF